MRRNFSFGSVLISCCLLISCSIFIFSCKGKKGAMDMVSLNKFPQVQVPDMIDNQVDAAKYYALNYWKDFLDPNRLLQLEYSKDTSGVLGVSGKVFQDAFIGYIKALQAANHYPTANAGERDLMKKADSLAMTGDKKFLGKIIEYSEKYLYEPNSPYLDEQLYVPILEGIIDAQSIPANEKIGYIAQFKMAILNMIGARANDFEFSTGTETKNLYDIDAEYTLIYFNNPDCSDCVRVLNVLKNSDVIINMIGQDRLAILSLYPDKNLAAWRKGKSLFPKDWIYAYDPKGAINSGKIYSLRAIPSLYLLDEHKAVILKDATADKVIAKLQDALYQNDVMDAKSKKEAASADSAAAALGL
jgi:hypothetical protein